MSYIKTRGIVIRQSDVGDADKVLTVLTQTQGKVSVWAKGARRQRSRLMASSQIFCVSEMVLYKGKSSWQLNSGEVVESFFNLRKDLERLTYATYILQLVNDVLQEEEKSSQTMRLLLNTLHFIANTDRNPKLMTRIFELRLMALQGYKPEVNVCASCQESIPSLVQSEACTFFFDIEEGIILCSDCCVPAKQLKPISPSTALAIFHIINAPLEKLFSFNVDESTLNELTAFCRSYITKHLDKEYRGLDFLREI